MISPNSTARAHPQNWSTSADANQYWDSWNQTWRFRDDCDVFMESQHALAISVAREAGLREARILDVGCGTGWLGNALRPFGRVGGIVWLEVMGVFFLLPVMVFTPTVWRTRMNCAAGLKV